MTISGRTKYILWGKAAARCSFSDSSGTCENELVKDGSELNRNVVLGEIAHIVARSKNGPRGGEQIPGDGVDIDGCGNLILLCEKHHKIIDGNPSAYPVSGLVKMKLDHEARVSDRLSHDILKGCRMLYLPPPPRPRRFVGRHEESAQLREALYETAPSVIVVLGMPGQGKTTLVYETLIDEGPSHFEAGFWCSVEATGFSFDMFLDTALNHLLEGEFDKRRFPATRDRITKFLDVFQGSPTLVVIDGIERWLTGWNLGKHFLTASSSTEQRRGYPDGLDEFLRAATGIANGSHLILTSRALPAALDMNAYTTVPREGPRSRSTLGGIDDDAAVKLFESFDIKGESREILRLSNLYENYPLALMICADLIKRKYDGRLQPLSSSAVMDPGRMLFKLLDEARCNLPGGSQSERILEIVSLCLERPTLDVVAKVFEELTPRRTSWLARLFQQSDREKDTDPQDLREQILSLAEGCSLGWNSDGGTMQLHPVVKEFYAGRCRNPHSIHRSLAGQYARIPTPLEPVSIEQVQPRLWAIEHALRSGDLHWCAELLFAPWARGDSFFQWLIAWGHFTNGIDLLGRLTEVAVGEPQATFLLAHSTLLYRHGQPEQAEAGINRAVTIFGQVLGRASPERLSNYAKALGCRGNIQRELGRSSLAIPDFDNAIRFFLNDRTHQTEAELEIGKTLINRGCALQDLGRWSEALTSYDSAESVLGGLAVRIPKIAEPTLAFIQTNQGIAWAAQRKFHQALSLFMKAIDSFVLLIRADRKDLVPQLARVRIMLGSTLNDLGRREEAITAFNQAIDELRQLLDTGRRDVLALLALACMDRARAYLEMNLLAASLRDCNESIQIYGSLIAEGTPKREGALAHALLIRAEVLYAMQARQDSAKDREEGIRRLEVLMRRWSDECDIFIVYLKKGLATVQYLLPEDPEQSMGLLSKLLERVDQALNGQVTSEGVQHEARLILTVLEDLFPRLDETRFETESKEGLLRRLRCLIMDAKLTDSSRRKSDHD